VDGAASSSAWPSRSSSATLMACPSHIHILMASGNDDDILLACHHHMDALHGLLLSRLTCKGIAYRKSEC
jgi:hypothetical protein